MAHVADAVEGLCCGGKQVMPIGPNAPKETDVTIECDSPQTGICWLKVWFLGFASWESCNQGHRMKGHLNAPRQLVEPDRASACPCSAAHLPR